MHGSTGIPLEQLDGSLAGHGVGVGDGVGVGVGVGGDVAQGEKSIVWQR